MEPRAKRIATIIIGGKSSESSPTEYDGESMGNEAMISAAKSAMNAIKTDNPSMFAESMKTMFSCMGE
jgi:hypothetical protein